MPNYATTRDRVETYFDRTATKAWERLTSDAPSAASARRCARGGTACAR
jgi:magnesium-protoporphyrin O-methyltransferase